MNYSIFIYIPKKVSGIEFADLGKKGITKISLPSYKDIQDGFKSKCEVIFNTLYALHHFQSKDKWRNEIFISYMKNTYKTDVEDWMVKELFKTKNINRAFKKKCRFYYDADLIMKSHGFKSLAEVKKYVRGRTNEILNKEKVGFDQKVLHILEVAKLNNNIVDKTTIESAIIVKTKKTLYKYFKKLKEIKPRLIILSKEREAKFYRLTLNKTFVSVNNLNEYLVFNDLRLDIRTLKQYAERFAIKFREPIPEVNERKTALHSGRKQTDLDELFDDLEILKNSNSSDTL